MGKTKERPYTIMPTDSNHCYLCDKFVDKYRRQWHHCIHGTSNRAIADREGLIVCLCPECHTVGKYAVHGKNGKSADLMLERDAQDVWETQYIVKNNATREEAREAFRELFGKSYIYD